MTADRLDELTIGRIIGAPIDDVWHAWTTEAGLASWWWSGWDDTTYEVDARVGGTYRIIVPSVGIAVSGMFLAMTPPRHLHMTWTWTDDDGAGPTEHVTVDLDDRGPRTHVQVHHTGAWTSPEPATAYRQGWNDVLDSLTNAIGSDQAGTTS